MSARVWVEGKGARTAAAKKHDSLRWCNITHWETNKTLLWGCVPPPLHGPLSIAKTNSRSGQRLDCCHCPRRRRNSAPTKIKNERVLLNKKGKLSLSVYSTAPPQTLPIHPILYRAVVDLSPRQYRRFRDVAGVLMG